MPTKKSQGEYSIVVKSDTWLMWRQCDEAHPMCDSKSLVDTYQPFKFDMFEPRMSKGWAGVHLSR